jgi:Leucine-rich repeat (LRR) protein
MSRLKTFAIELVSFRHTDCVQVLRAPKDWTPYGSLATLDLHDTNLATLDSYRELTQLLPSVEIICGSNFRDVADALARPPHEVIELNLRSLNLTSVPEALKACVNLKKLSLYDEIVPESFENIPARCLEELLADCKLSFFPPAIANFSSLKHLDLGGPFGTTNAISEIPEWIGKLQLLETLWLAGNEISRFPSSISMCRNLRTLVLFNDDGDYRHGNPICSDNAAISQLRGWLPHATIVIVDDE